ncbi:MAG: hypothetical protein KDD42_09215, partial [Bdellovibrionales bacterium]|nr:hypothetical protein [Bdellovibrionales bacterium]
VAKEEKMQIEPEALRMIARYADGSMRDGQSILDRVQSFCNGKISAADVGQMLGSVERRVLFDLSAAIFQHDSKSALGVLSRAFASGLDVSLFLKEFVSHWRELLVTKFGSSAALEQFGFAEEDLVEMQRQVSAVSTNDLQDLVQIAREGADSALRSSFPKYALEALVVRMALRQPVAEIAQLLNYFKSNKQASLPAVPAGQSGAAVKKNSLPVEQPKNEPPQRSGDLDWGAFVRASTKSCGRMLSEYLKRLVVENFEKGQLLARGPEFSVKSINSDENKQRLLGALREYSGADKWNVVIEVGQESDSLSKTLLDEEQERQIASQEAQRQNITNHPKFRSLQKVFPGSTIEEIVSKE